MTATGKNVESWVWTKKKIDFCSDCNAPSKSTKGIYLGLRLEIFFGWPEVPILFQNLRSELIYTFKWTKSVARLWRNQICEWTLKKKNSSTYRPIGEMEGRVWEMNIFLRVAQHGIFCFSFNYHGIYDV